MSCGREGTDSGWTSAAEGDDLPRDTWFKSYESYVQMLSADDDWRNMLIWGDNLHVLASLADRYSGQVDLIYNRGNPTGEAGQGRANLLLLYDRRDLAEARSPGDGGKGRRCAGLPVDEQASQISIAAAVIGGVVKDGGEQAGRIGQAGQHWTAPGILEALIPGRMQGHGGTAEVPRGARRARGEDGATASLTSAEAVWFAARLQRHKIRSSGSESPPAGTAVTHSSTRAVITFR
jgi:hypothetical protein